MNIDFTNKKTIALLSRCRFVDAAWQSDSGGRFLGEDC